LIEYNELYDIIAKVESNTREEVKELISERIRKVIRITGTVTVIIAKDTVIE
jgi:hypothetical protein